MKRGTKDPKPISNKTTGPASSRRCWAMGGEGDEEGLSRIAQQEGEADL